MDLTPVSQADADALEILYRATERADAALAAARARVAEGAQLARLGEGVWVRLARTSEESLTPTTS